MRNYLVGCYGTVGIYDYGFVHQNWWPVSKEIKFRAKNTRNAKKRFRKIIKEVEKNPQKLFGTVDDDYYQNRVESVGISLFREDRHADDERGEKLMYELLEF